MEFLPRTMGTRPRMAVEVRAEGVVAARADAGAAVLAAIGRGDLPTGAIEAGLKAGNVADRAAVVAAIRRALDGIAVKGGERSRFVTLVVPDAAVRVLLLDFDALPSKSAEALAVVRFRLKKLLPFDAEHAVLSYQVMSTGRDGVRVLAVAMPCEVLSEYEAVVTEAGYQPGSVLPSTLAAIAGLSADEDGAATLVVNAGTLAVTTAIVRGGVMLLHRTVDLGAGFGREDEDRPGVPEVLGGGQLPASVMAAARLPLVDRESTAEEWSRPDEYDRMDALTEIQARVLRSEAAGAGMPTEVEEAVQVLNASEPVSAGREVTQAVSVAAAYFEDTLGGAPPAVLAAGPMGAERLTSVLAMYGMEDLPVREMVGAAVLGAGASTTQVPYGWLAGVWGALRS